MSCVHQNVRVPILRDFPVEVSRVQNTCELTPAILTVGAQVGVQLLQALKLAVAWGSLMRIASLVRNSHDITLLRRLLDERQ